MLPWITMNFTRFLRLLPACVCLSFSCAAQTPTPANIDSTSPIYRPAPPPMPPWKQKELMMSSMMSGRREFRAPASAWFEQERQTFAAVLAASRAQVFVAPVQVHLHGLDRSTRSMMAAHLAAALGTGGEGANSFAVQRALGEGLRRVPLVDLQKLAGAIGAARLIVTYAGHDGRGTLVVTLQSWTFDASTTLWKPGAVIERKTAIGENEAPAQAFQARILPELTTSLGGKPPNTGSATDASGFAEWPSSIAQAFEWASASAVGESVYAQILGMLSPEAPERARERLFEQSLVALDPVGNAAADARLLRARALYYLHSRPAAIEALGKPRDAKEEAFRAFLDGNLPDLQAATARIPEGVFRVFAEIELRDLQLAYLVPVPKDSPAVASVKPQWRALLARRLAEGDRWQVQENVALKALLDQVMPIAGFDLETAARGSHALGRGIDEEALGLLVFDHIQRLRRSEAFLAQCPLGKRQCARGSFLDLVEAVAISNATRAIGRAALQQGAFDSADNLARTFAVRLEGQPEFVLIQSQSLLERTTNKTRAPEAQQEASLQSAIVAMYWEQGQSRTAYQAVVYGARTPELMPLLDEYLHDLPARSFWSDQVMAERETAAQIARARAQLRESTTDIRPAKALAMALPKDQLSALALEVAGRFKGHPQRASLASLLPAAEPASGATAPASAAIADAGAKIAAFLAAQGERPDLWTNYRDHGDYLVHEKGAFKEAAEAYLRFPGFRESARAGGYNPVALGNHAFEAGSMLYYRGDFEDARKLYRIAANLKTGSAASLFSESRLALLDGNLELSAERSFDVAQRYNNAYAVRDYLAWIFVFGHRRDAWAAFASVAPELANPQAWSAAHVGKRLEARSESELREWLQSEPIRTLGSPQRFALIEAVMLNTVDRKPWTDLPDFMRKVEGTPLAKFDTPSYKGGTIKVPASERGSYFMVARPQMRTINPALKEDEPVSSDLVFFADAYVPLREGKFAEAADRFQAMAQLYPIEGGSLAPLLTSYPLAYYAWASAKAGDAHKLESFLDKREVRFFENFDHHLAKAAFTGLRGEHDAAVRHLERAFNYRPHTESRPIFTEYQWAELCDWLFDATGETRYRDLALRMARINQKIHPFFAWSYAMEAKLTPPGKERTRALALALYLDPNSERIERFPGNEKAAARAWFGKNNPFKPKAAEKKRAASLH